MTASTTRLVAVISLASSFVHAADPVRLAAGGLSVDLDPAFPRAIRYERSGERWAGQLEPVAKVQINGTDTTCAVTFRRRGSASAEYHLDVPASKLSMDLGVTVEDRAISWQVRNLREAGPARVKSLAFPGNALLQVNSVQSNAAWATVLFTTMNDNAGGVYRERIGPVTDGATGADTGNYLFLSAGRLAAGIGCGNFTDIQRVAWRLSETNGVRTCAAQNPLWEFRRFDDEPATLPWVKVFITDDLNGDGAATWQDAAIVYRRGMPMPFGHETVKELVAENIAMNFASGAQQPFLQILDGVKRTWLATDGLGQHVIIKGFSSEGHDSANTDGSGHWNERAGGLRDFTVLLNRARDFNARIGIHLNASEAYPEAHRYLPEILQRDAKGNFKPGWTWLDHAHMIDKVSDIRSGRLFAMLDAMRHDLPRLDGLYVDTYWEHGWPAWQTARKINALGLPMYTEGDMALDPWTVWSHWRGRENRIVKFIWFSDRDLFANDAILRAGRGDNNGFMGWQNQHDFNSHIRTTFAQRLPSKFLQHFELLRWQPGSLAEFSGGVRVSKDSDRVTVVQAGDERMSWTGGGASQRLFIPWPPQEPTKIYVWDEVGGDLSRKLPPSWRNRKSVFLYQLAGTGRTNETEVSVREGNVTLNVEKGIPHVLYPKRAGATPSLEWTEGGPLRDAGFDSRGFMAWKPTGSDLRVAEGPRGDPRLVIGPAAGSVSQAIRGLEAGRTYVAAAWVQVTGARLASVEVHCGGHRLSNYVTRTTVRHSAPNDPRSGTKYQRLAVLFDTPPGVKEATLVLKAEEGGTNTLVEFDAARVVPAHRAAESAKHTFWEDFEDVPLGGYGPFTGCPDENTHLAEANPPYTQDTISGRFSLKSRGRGRILFTLPSTMRLKPLTRYRVMCDTIGAGHLTAEFRGQPLLTLSFPNKTGDAAGTVTGEFTTPRSEDVGLALYRDGGDFIAIDNLAVDELGPAPEPPAPVKMAAEPLPSGMQLLMEEAFEAPLASDWKTTLSPRAGTRIATASGGLLVEAAANTSAVAERQLPAGVALVECRLENESDDGETWGPGLCVLWTNGAALRVNLRAGGQFGVDTTVASQKLVGGAAGDQFGLRIRIAADAVFAESRSESDTEWRTLAQFPRSAFPGAPSRVRLGKMHAVEGLDDNASAGNEGMCRFTELRVAGQK